jgi:hypothetical protein
VPLAPPASRHLTAPCSGSTHGLERELTKPWDVFVEYGGDYPTHAESRQLVHVGTAYKLTPHHQIDFHAGFGLTHATREHFIAAGYSFRFDHVLFRKGAVRRQRPAIQD